MSKKSKLIAYSLKNHIEVRGWKPAYLGIVVALIFLVFSFLPSLLPRPWYIQGLISGLSMAIGYLMGATSSVLIRWFTEKEISANQKEWAWKILLVFLPVTLFAALFYGRVWQNEVRRLLDVETIGPEQSILIIASTITSFVVVYFIGRLFLGLTKRFRTALNSKTPRRVSAAIAISMTVFIFYFVTSGVFARTFFKLADRSF